MSLADDLRGVLEGVAAALRKRGTEDTARMAEQSAAILAGHVAASPADVQEHTAVSLIDHLFRGSAAAGAIQSMPEPAPAKPAAPAAKPAAAAPPPRLAAINPSKETT